MAGIEIVFETHSWSADNDHGIATGWHPGQLSDRGRQLAAELGQRRRSDRIDAVFTSDLRRAVQTAEVAFAGSTLTILHDWRLRECDFGALNGAPAETVHRDRRRFLDEAYPGGESWRQAVDRATRFLADLPLRWTGKRVLVIGHVSTRWALDQALAGRALDTLIDSDFGWQEGWEYLLTTS
ncbi:MAG: 2,3-bisphosphoglycerate-dependent phosphoglycerate mutase [Pseudonocardiales bacterium]|jgi:broad specificity phosphatase PhoE|nr:2,3-bisphosphoglycerate-dependent phosphoglycerate mutase [Pseudonocardiales bacterium]